MMNAGALGGLLVVISADATPRDARADVETARVAMRRVYPNLPYVRGDLAGI
jgi:hypothetical protein